MPKKLTNNKKLVFVAGSRLAELEMYLLVAKVNDLLDL